MRILVTSDIHGARELLDFLRKIEKYDIHIDAGDSNLSLTDLSIRQIISVKGNTDFFINLPPLRILENEFGKILITHGHNYHVKMSLTNLFEAGKYQQANYVVYGHTHEQRLDIKNNIYYLNPGSLRYSKQYAIIEKDEVLLKELP